MKKLILLLFTILFSIIIIPQTKDSLSLTQYNVDQNNNVKDEIVSIAKDIETDYKAAKIDKLKLEKEIEISKKLDNKKKALLNIILAKLNKRKSENKPVKEVVEKIKVVYKNNKTEDLKLDSICIEEKREFLGGKKKCVKWQYVYKK